MLSAQTSGVGNYCTMHWLTPYVRRHLHENRKTGEIPSEARIW